MKKKTKAAVSRRIKLIAILGILTAMSVALGAYDIRLGNSFRISLGNLPTIFCGIALGPLAGAVVGLVSDILVCFIRSYEINPIITVGATMTGLLAGICVTHRKKNDLKIPYLRTLFAVFTAHVVGSIIIKSVGLYVFYDLSWMYLFTTRVPVYFVNIIVESTIIYLLLRSKAIRHSLKGFIK